MFSNGSCKISILNEVFDVTLSLCVMSTNRNFLADEGS
jgi:hypothetical protein